MKEEALNKFWEYSKSNKTDEAKEYLLSRQFELDDFEWGFFPHNEESTQLLIEHRQDYAELSMAIPDYATNGIKTTFFYDRIIFPIRDISGKLIAVAGRPIIDPCPKPKYYNSHYAKRFNLYYLNEAIPYIRKHNFVLVCEGYFAALRLHHTCNIKNVVATCGTLFTREQYDLLSRYTDNIVFLRDADEAGIKAALKAKEEAEQFIPNRKKSCEIYVHAVQLDKEGDDPDDYVLKYGKKKLVELVNAQYRQKQL